ncbi:MAG TPA: GDP-mannose 4,6-dehydratase [Xanthobacteraceae bacterium]|nr:GDP-mannose 4,6-dehydratase [Xanthobacteraceae bacterium]
MSERVALIIGGTGQDGAYLAHFLLGKGYRVHATSRDAALARLDGLDALGIRDQVTVHSMSPIDCHSVAQVIEAVAPREIYNLAGPSSVALSFSQPAETLESIVLGTLNMLEVLRHVGSQVRFYNAGSSESFGDTGTRAADESTIARPKSPYGVAKAAATSLVTNYRESYGLFASSGLLFNHESPLRPNRFVTRKVTQAAARIARGSPERLALGNLAIRRDWGWAPDFVEAMWRMLQRNEPDDFVIASGTAHSLEEFVAAAFGQVGLNWRDHVEHDPALTRPSDIMCSLGDPTKAAKLLGWRPTVAFPEIVARMIRAEGDGAIGMDGLSAEARFPADMKSL